MYNLRNSDLKPILEHHFKDLLPLFKDSRYSDIEVNPDGQVFVHCLDGKMQKIEAYIPPSSITAVGLLLASKTQNNFNDESPSVAAMWDDPPMRLHIVGFSAVNGPCLVARKFSPIVYPLSYFVETGSCTEIQAEILRSLVRKRKNIIISGETGSGKTTLLNSLIREIPDSDRVFIIEDTPELQCSEHMNKVSFCTGEKYSARSAIKDSLRMRPDRIIVGEVRDGAALDLLEAWNTGHPGGLCSIHANSPDTVKQRLKSLILQVSVNSQDELIDLTVDAIVQITLCPDGKRRITEIKEFR